MHKLSVLSVLSVLFFTGCASFQSPMVTPICDITYPHTQAVVSSDGSIGSKVGSAGSVTVMCLVSFGNASVVEAARNGNITQIKTIDHQYINALGLVQRFYTIVTGE